MLYLGFQGVASFMTGSILIEVSVKMPVIISSLQCVKSQGISGCSDATSVIHHESGIQFINIATVSCAGMLYIV